MGPFLYIQKGIHNLKMDKLEKYKKWENVIIAIDNLKKHSPM